MINPTIIERSSNTLESYEECPSIPKIKAKINRA